jgi:GTP-binding protein
MTIPKNQEMVYGIGMLVDELTIKVKAGAGGNGTVAFSKVKMELGPTGGTGGNGGNIYVEGVADIGALTRLRNKKVFRAGNGGTGGYKRNEGKTGDDIIIAVPVGTVVHNLAQHSCIEILHIGQRMLVAHGGKGGHGNFFFRSSTNTSPKQSKKGTKGEEFRLRLELKLIADVGLIGLPNAGKSSLINELTRAKSKVANYPFTTLEPNLGTYYSLILADIPGLIEGASHGKGLGMKFLRHVERTKVLFHLVAADSENPVTDYKTVRDELGKYNPILLAKPEYLFMTKTDLVEPARIKKLSTRFKKLNPSPLLISIHDWESLEKIKKILNSLQKEK